MCDPFIMRKIMEVGITMADLDLESYEAAMAWMDAHGDEEIDYTDVLKNLRD